jgi:hypothetical protein
VLSGHPQASVSTRPRAAAPHRRATRQRARHFQALKLTNTNTNNINNNKNKNNNNS